MTPRLGAQNGFESHANYRFWYLKSSNMHWMTPASGSQNGFRSHANDRLLLSESHVSYRFFLWCGDEGGAIFRHAYMDAAIAQRTGAQALTAQQAPSSARK